MDKSTTYRGFTTTQYVGLVPALPTPCSRVATIARVDERLTYEVHSPAHVAAMLRTLIADLQDKPGDGPVFIGEPGGAPAAVLLPFAAYQSFQQAAEEMEDRDIARIVAERLAPAPSEGLDNEALARFVQDEPDTT